MRARACFTMARYLRAFSTMTSGLPDFSASARTNSPPMPKAAAPASINSAAVFRLTPPVGTSGTCGSGPFRALMYFAPPTSPQGKILTKSDPALQAVITSVGESSCHYQYSFSNRKFNYRNTYAWTDQELGAGIEAASCHLNIKHRSRSNEHFRGASLSQLADYLDSTGHGHSDFDDGDATFADRFSSKQCLLGRGGAHDRHYANFSYSITNLLLIHSRSSFAASVQRAMRAPPFHITWITSFKVTMLVSPGVVMASAP